MKKIISLLLSLLLIAGCSTPTNNNDSMKAGTYTASAAGYHGDITIAVTVDSGSIKSIEVTDENETEGIGKAALPSLVEQAVKDQTVEVDVVTGATITSEGFKVALKDAMTQAGADLSKFSNASGNESIEQVEETTDVVVVGGGVAGLSAALTAQQQGKKVILVEKMNIAGGASAMAGAGTTATGSKWQQEDGYKDSPESLKEDMLKNGHNYNDEATLDIFVNTVGAAFDWIVSEDGAHVPYVRTEGGGRTYSAEGRGAGVVTSLTNSFTEGGGTLYLGTKGTELIVEDNVVKGIKATAKGKEYTIHADAVILATGGFGNNDEMIPDEIQNEYVYAGAAGAEGDGLKMAEAVDAATINMEFINVQPNSIVMPSGLGQYTNPGVGKAYAVGGAFLVNEKGERFTNEQGNAYDLIQAMKVNKANYLILNEEAFNAFNEGMMASKIYSEDDVKEWLANAGTSNPVMIEGKTLADLETSLSLPGGSLSASAEKFDASVKQGKDEYGRELKGEITTDGPYYAIQMWLRYYATLGGLKINDNMQVVNTKNEPIQGLYAAGEVVGGLEGDIYYGGSLFGWAVTSGHNAGLSVIEK